MDRFHQIQVFVAVVDAQGFAGAARKLDMSPPAVTRAVADLEAVLGVRLLTRTTRVVRVTEAGERYAQDCRRILAELREADESASGLHSEPRGRLTVTAPMLLGSKLVMPIVTEYLARYPQVQASCLFLDRVVSLVEEGVDVAVRVGELPDSSLQAIRVGAVRRVIVGSPQYLARHGTPQQPQDLTAHCIVAASGVTPTAEWQLLPKSGPVSVHVTPRLSCTSNDGALRAACEGFGLTRLLSYQVAEAVAAGRLVRVLQEAEPRELPVHVVHQEGRFAARKARAFIDLTVERLRAHPALQG